MEELQDFKEEKESNFDLKAEIFKYLAYWHWILLGFLVGGLLAYLYNRYTIPKYHTQSTIQIMKDGEKNVMSALPAGRGSSFLSLQNDGLENHIEKLRSKSLLESVVDELDHNISYFIEGNVITVEAYESSPIRIQLITPDSLVNKASANLKITPLSDTEFRLEEESKAYNRTHKIGEVINFEGSQFTILPKTGGEEGSFKTTNTVNIRLMPVRDVARDYLNRLVIQKKGQAQDMLAISMVHPTIARTEDFLNKLMERFNEEEVNNNREVAENTTRFIQDRLERITTELDSVEGGIADFKRENRLMDVGSTAGIYQSQYSAAERQIFDLETQLALLSSVEELLQDQKDYELLPEAGITEGGISGLTSSYNTLVMERNLYLRNSTPENPVVEALSDQLDALKINLFENIQSTRRSLNVQIRELNQRGDISQGQFSNFPGLEKGMRSIERQQQIKEQLYLFLLQRREEAAISFAATASVARIVDPAYTNPSPVDPKPWLILLGGFVLGLILPIVILFVKFMLDSKVHHKGDLAPVIKTIPFLGEVPRVSGESQEVIQLNDRSPLAESFRILRTNLAYLMTAKKENRGEVIFVTSTIKGEGKTFISYNLARTLASTNKRVLVIGADIRNPKLHRYLDLPMETQGLSDYLYDYDINPGDIITASEDREIQVDLILSGTIPPNPAELLMNDRMEALIKELSHSYDFVIVDTAPTMIVTDTLLISPLADTTLYVTRAGYTDKKLLDFPKDLKQQGKLKGLAIILNDVDYSKFSYGAKYGYSYGYGYGYGVDKEPKWKRFFKKGS
jgi:tyrosine-protein kinase Etk/Wzc